MPVLDYTLAIDKPPSPGEIATLDDALIWTYFNSENAIAPFGIAMFRGTGVKDVVFAVDINSVFEGVVLATDTYERRDGYTRDASTGRLGWPKKEFLSLVRRGVIWVFTDGAVTRGAPAFARAIENPGVTGIKGCFRADADTNTAIAIPNAKFVKAAAAPAAGKMNLAQLDLKMAA